MKTKKITGLIFALSLSTVLSQGALADVTTTGTGDTTSADSSASSTASTTSSSTPSTASTSSASNTANSAMFNGVDQNVDQQAIAQSIAQGTVIDQQQAASDANEYLNAMAPTLQNNATNELGNYSASALNNVEADSVASRNAYATEQWNDSNNSWGTSAIQGAGQSSEAGGCDSDVSKGLLNAQLQEIAGAKKLAAQTIKPPPSNAFKNLVNSGCIPGFGGNVGFPSLAQLADIHGKLAQQLCQAAQNMEQNYLNQYVASPLSSIAANTNIGLGSIGGYSLGSVPLGVQTSASITTGGKGGVNFSSDAVQTIQSLGTDATNTINGIRGTGGNGGSGGMSSNGIVKNAMMIGLKALKSKL